MKALRRISGKTKHDRIRNERIRDGLKQASVVEKIEKKQLKWFGHINRMKEYRKPKQYLEARPEGRKQRGRPRVSYIDVIEDLGRKRGKTLKDLERMTKDRKIWKDFIKRHPTL